MLFIIAVVLLLSSCKEKVTNPEAQQITPEMFPDYTEVTIPVNIAPLNFFVIGPRQKIHLLVEGGKSGKFEVRSKGLIAFPKRKWRKILTENAGDKIILTLSIKSGKFWKQYASFNIYVSAHPIDYGLAYRLIAPGYEVYSKMGVYQRNLSNFKQRAVLENTLVHGSCINCHSFNRTNTQQMSLHVRGNYGGTIIQNNNNLKIADTRTEQTISAGVYPYWHPSGRFIAYSVNRTQQAFHSSKEKLIEVVDLASDIVVLDLETDELLSCDLLMTSNFETFPSFSPDGKTLYFCVSSEQKLPEDYQKIRYNLCSISFDAQTRTFGDKIDTLISADTAGKSVSFPKPSYDGKYIMYTLLDYGNFGIWHQEADLHVLKLEDLTTHELTEANSLHADSYQSWSSNSRWVVFGSRRLDRLYTRPYIAAIDENGQAAKPFLLPQKNPKFYLESLYSFNVTEFINAPVELNANRTARKLISQKREKVKYIHREYTD